MSDFKRIGTDYYKVCNVPLMSRDFVKTLIKWSKGEIITDKGKDFLQTIKKYDGFITIPDNQNYKQEINSFYNEYEKIEHKFINGEFPATEQFLRHIFKEQYNLGLDYLTILWQKPTQILPILCLVSDKRNTGKTSFLNWLKLIFQGNMTINKNEDFRSRFNSDWSSKLIIAIDEVLLDRREDSERIKNLSTASSYKTESKGKDKGNKTYLSQEIKEILIDEFIRYNVTELKFTATDLLEKLKEGSIRTTRFNVSKILKNDYNLEPVNGSYKRYFLSLNTLQKTIVDFEIKKGRYFEFLKKDFIENNVDS